MPIAYKSTPTFNLDGDVGWGTQIKGVDTHVDSSVISSWFVQPAEHKHTRLINSAVSTHTFIKFVGSFVWTPTCTRCSCSCCVFQGSPPRSSSRSSPGGRCGRWSGCTAVWASHLPRGAWCAQRRWLTALEERHTDQRQQKWCLLELVGEGRCKQQHLKSSDRRQPTHFTQYRAGIELRSGRKYFGNEGFLK